MAKTMIHCGTKIVTLENGDDLHMHSDTDDIVLLEDEAGWWVHFVGENGASDTYDTPFPSYNQALWAAKAAAEFNSTL